MECDYVVDLLLPLSLLSSMIFFLNSALLIVLFLFCINTVNLLSANHLLQATFSLFQFDNVDIKSVGEGGGVFL